MEFMFRVSGENFPRAGTLFSLTKGYLMKLFGKRGPNGKAAKTLYPSLALFEVERARA